MDVGGKNKINACAKRFYFFVGSFLTNAADPSNIEYKKCGLKIFEKQMDIYYGSHYKLNNLNFIECIP